MDTKDLIGNEGVSIIKNPFLPSCIYSVDMHATTLFNGRMIFFGDVGFVNGKTNGTQKFEGENLADLFNQIATFCTNLK